MFVLQVMLERSLESIHHLILYLYIQHFIQQLSKMDLLMLEMIDLKLIKDWIKKKKFLFE